MGHTATQKQGQDSNPGLTMGPVAYGAGITPGQDTGHPVKGQVPCPGWPGDSGRTAFIHKSGVEMPPKGLAKDV